MVHLSFSLWRFCLLSLPLASSLSIPQKTFVEESEDTAFIHDLVLDDIEFNITDYTSPEEWNLTTWDYDVVIVGGGPAGLAASMSLARVARKSLLYDSQEYRNGQTRYMHDVLGQDGRSVFPCNEGHSELNISRSGTTEISISSSTRN